MYNVCIFQYRSILFWCSAFTTRNFTISFPIIPGFLDINVTYGQTVKSRIITLVMRYSVMWYGLIDGCFSCKSPSQFRLQNQNIPLALCIRLQNFIIKYTPILTNRLSKMPHGSHFMYYYSNYKINNNCMCISVVIVYFLDRLGKCLLRQIFLLVLLSTAGIHWTGAF